MEKYRAYKFIDDNELETVLSSSGFTWDGLIQMVSNIIHSSGEVYDFHYVGQIVLNYPDTVEGWESEISTEVYITAVKHGSAKIPETHKVKGQSRKYYWQYINHFAGEAEPTE